MESIFNEEDTERESFLSSLETHIESCKSAEQKLSTLLDKVRIEVRNRTAAQRKLLLMLDLTTAVTSAASFEIALDQVLKKICLASGWLLGDAWEVNQKTNELTFLASYFNLSDEKNNLQHLKPGDPLNRKVMPNRALSTGNNSWFKGLPAGEAFLNTSTETEEMAALAIPAVSDGRVIAILVFYTLGLQPKDFQYIDLIKATTKQLTISLEQKKTEHELRSSELQFRYLIESSPDCILLFDSNYQILSANRSTEDTFHYASVTLLNKPVTMLFPERFRDAFIDHVEEYIHQKAKLNAQGKIFELYGLKQEGEEFLINLSLGFWRDQNKIFYSAFISDKSANRDVLHKEFIEPQQVSA